MSERYASLLLFGSPGVGKGTQGHLLGCIPGLHHLATGDMFRGLNKASELGQRFLEYSSKGLLVPDDLTVELWKQHVANLVASGVYHPDRDLLVLDGIPRSITQAEALDDLIEVVGIVHLEAPNLDILIERMKRRADEQGRHDDADEAVVRHRFEVYEAETRPVLAFYPTNLVSSVSAMGPPVDVLHRVLGVVAPLYMDRFKNPLKRVG